VVASLKMAGLLVSAALAFAIVACGDETTVTDDSKAQSGEARLPSDGAGDSASPKEPTAPDPAIVKANRFLRAVDQQLIPFPAARRQEMVDYSTRHYGDGEWRLKKPKVIVEHFAVAPSNDSIYNTFYGDTPDPELGELPNVCAHFAVDDAGQIIQMVKLNTRCRHTVGLNYTAIGIEHVGYSDQDVIGNPAEFKASLKLTHALMCRYGIKLKNVIGHNESLGSPFHKEADPALQTQTHGDMTKATMDIYRAELKKLGPCRTS